MNTEKEKKKLDKDPIIILLIISKNMKEKYFSVNKEISYVLDYYPYRSRKYLRNFDKPQTPVIINQERFKKS